MSENKVSYAGQVVVITGAARGIGAATARLVAERGGKVFALDIARDGLTALQKELSLADDQIATIDLGNQ
ncbi:MAG: short chain dehydrogenase, partial [Actinomycetota bacterium]